MTTSRPHVYKLRPSPVGNSFILKCLRLLYKFTIWTRYCIAGAHLPVRGGFVSGAVVEEASALTAALSIFNQTYTHTALCNGVACFMNLAISVRFGSLMDSSDV